MNELMKNLMLKAVFNEKGQAVLRDPIGFYIGVFNVDTPTPVWEIGVTGLWYYQTPVHDRAKAIAERWLS